MSKLKYQERGLRQSSNIVYVLSYLRLLPDGHWTGEFIGIYSSLEEAEGAKKRVLSRPSYSAGTYSFRVDDLMLNVDYDGSHFFGMPPPSGPPPEDENGPKSSLS
jgi:hypothetical protein